MGCKSVYGCFERKCRKAGCACMVEAWGRIGFGKFGISAGAKECNLEACTSFLEVLLKLANSSKTSCISLQS